MFANRFTAFVDACVLAGALKRNLLLTLAEAEFFRVRWSLRALQETEGAITKILTDRSVQDAAAIAARQIVAMTDAFEDAMVNGYESLLPACAAFPDPGDHHVVAAALKTQASVIVTDNLKDFPAALLAPLNIEPKTADDFIADTIDLNPGRAVPAIQRMRLRFKRPEKTPAALFLDMEACGLIATVDVLRQYEHSL